MASLGASENKRKWKEKQKRKGLCINCTNKALKGNVYCRKHYIYYSYAMKHERELRRKSK